jgi:hypothetical protein
MSRWRGPERPRQRRPPPRQGRRLARIGTPMTRTTCPSKVCDCRSLLPGRHRPASHLSWNSVRFRVLYETAYRASWVTRSRPGVTVSGSPSRYSCRFRLPNVFTPGSSSPALGHTSRVSRATAGPALMSGLPSLGFPPSSRHHPAESTGASLPSPHRSVLDVSHVLDGFLLRRTSRVYFTPQPRPGFDSSGVSPDEKPHGLVARRCPPVVRARPLPQV